MARAKLMSSARIPQTHSRQGAERRIVRSSSSTCPGCPTGHSITAPTSGRLDREDRDALWWTCRSSTPLPRPAECPSMGRQRAVASAPARQRRSSCRQPQAGRQPPIEEDAIGVVAARTATNLGSDGSSDRRRSISPPKSDPVRDPVPRRPWSQSGDRSISAPPEHLPDDAITSGSECVDHGAALPRQGPEDEASTRHAIRLDANAHEGSLHATNVALRCRTRAEQPQNCRGQQQSGVVNLQAHQQPSDIPARRSSPPRALLGV